MSVSRKNATKMQRQQTLFDLIASQEKAKTRLATSTNLSPSMATMKGIIYEETSGGQFAEADKNNRARYKKYYDAKVVALKLESVNDSKLILFPSATGDEGEWYKMGGNSALYYKNIIGPRMGKKDIKIRRDSDMDHRFSGGVIAVHWKAKFAENMVKLGYEKFEENELGMLFFDLGVKFEQSEIVAYREKEKREKERVNQIIAPKNDYPDIYGLFLQLAKLLPPKLKRMHPAYREMFQDEFIGSLMVIAKSYVKMANGEMERLETLNNILVATDNLLAVLSIVSEAGIFDVIECAKIGEIVADLRNVAKRRLNV